jgi:hypothetical protein
LQKENSLEYSQSYATAITDAEESKPSVNYEIFMIVMMLKVARKT